MLNFPKVFKIINKKKVFSIFSIILIKIILDYFLTDIKNESAEDLFKTDLFSSFKHRVPVSLKSPVNLNRTFEIR